MKIALASDHAGYALKEHLKIFLEDKGYEIEDLGCSSEESVDYPEYGKLIGEKCTEDDIFGIAVCGSGIGISIAANRIPGARCALCTNEKMARLARQHNNAQILALGGRLIDFDIAEKAVETFLSTEFEGGRHQRRVDQLG